LILYKFGGKPREILDLAVKGLIKIMNPDEFPRLFTGWKKI